MLLLVDLDGVVYRGPEPVPGVPAVLADRAARGDDVVYVTNSSIWHHSDFVGRLERMGAPVSAARIVSGARATALYLSERSPRPRRVLVLGAPGLIRELAEAGFEILRAADAADAWRANGKDATAATAGVEAVVIGFDQEVDWARLVVTSTAVREGAHFVAVNRDPIHPTEHGLVPGAGALVETIAVAGATQPVVIGKPGPLLLEMAAHSVGKAVTDAIMIGDSLSADIPAAIAVGCRSILMLTGISAAEHAAALPPGQRPTYVAADADELAALLERIDAGK
jgi:glycerol-1-phosphatase